MWSVNTFLYLEISLLFELPICETTKTNLGVCKNQTHTSCCSNYYKVNGKCKKCPSGTYGEHCSQTCSNGFYGDFCLSKCSCKPNEICDLKIGCKLKDPLAYCPGSVCCVNYISVDGICEACPLGSFGFNCSQPCPNGFYGLFCKEKCTCETGCDKVFGCNTSISDSYSVPFENLIYALAPVIPAIMFCLSIFFLGKYMQRKCKRMKSSSKNFVDIPPYDISPCRVHDSNGELENTFGYGTQIENSETMKTKADKTKLSGFCNEEQLDDGVYHTLTLRVTGYEEPVKRKDLTRRYSDTSSTYIKSSACYVTPFEDGHNPFQKCKRFSSLRIKNIDGKDRCDESIRLQTIGAREHNLCVSSTKGGGSIPLALDVENIYDVAKFEERDETEHLNHKQLFLKELSAQLLNHTKIMTTNAYSPK